MKLYKEENTLHYCSPAHGGWGIVRAAMLVPESYQLFAVPFACGRHGALGAYQQGNKHRLSYLFIDEADIVSGSYEDLIFDGVGEFLEILAEKPSMMFIAVSCLDDLLGTDHKALMQRLRKAYAIDFQVLHMNPISMDSKTPPGINLQRSIYSLIHKEEKNKKQLNLIGNYVMPEKNNELFEILKKLGIEEIKSISECKSYEEFKSMGNSGYNLVLRPEARLAAEDIKKKLGTDYRFIPVTYDIDEVKKQYEIIKKFINEDSLEELNMNIHEQKTVKAIQNARKIIKDTPIFVDNSSTYRPYTMAKSLLKYGFNVQAVYQEGLPEFEKDSLKWLEENAPDIKIYDALNQKIIMRKNNPLNENMAIGCSAAYITEAKYTVDLIMDEQIFGFRGIELLMEKMIKAFLNPPDLKKLINGYGIVV